MPIREYYQFGNTGPVVARWDTTAGRVQFFLPDGSFLGPERDMTTSELSAHRAQDNEEALIAKASGAVSNNITFLADANVTQAEAVVQLQKLTKQVNALIKLQVRDFANTDGTD